MHARHCSAVVAAVAIAALSACSSPPAKHATLPTATSGAQTQSTQFGRVTDIQTAERKSVTGAVLGAVIGAAVGSQVGSGSGRTAATGVGAVGGAVAGHQIDKRRADDVYRISVRFDNGDTQQFDFERIDDLRVGDRVKWENGQLYRM